nr:MAG TPA: hypothetical protein [Caudoviricetes sp.]
MLRVLSGFPRACLHRHTYLCLNCRTPYPWAPCTLAPQRSFQQNVE